MLEPELEALFFSGTSNCRSLGHREHPVRCGDQHFGPAKLKMYWITAKRGIPYKTPRRVNWMPPLACYRPVRLSPGTREQRNSVLGRWAIAACSPLLGHPMSKRI